jgi:hypothetical protein
MTVADGSTCSRLAVRWMGYARPSGVLPVSASVPVQTLLTRARFGEHSSFQEWRQRVSSVSRSKSAPRRAQKLLALGAVSVPALRAFFLAEFDGKESTEPCLNSSVIVAISLIPNGCITPNTFAHHWCPTQGT